MGSHFPLPRSWGAQLFSAIQHRSSPDKDPIHVTNSIVQGYLSFSNYPISSLLWEILHIRDFRSALLHTPNRRMAQNLVSFAIHPRSFASFFSAFAPILLLSLQYSLFPYWILPILRPSSFVVLSGWFILLILLPYPPRLPLPPIRFLLSYLGYLALLLILSSSLPFLFLRHMIHSLRSLLPRC